MSVVWLFLKIGLFRYDEATLVDLARAELVEKQCRLSLEEMDEIADICKISYGSTKLTLAFLVGKYLGSLFYSTGLVLLVTLPSLAITGGLLYGLNYYLEPDYFHIITQGMIPVLAALFVVKGLDFLKKSYQELSLITWIIAALIAVFLLIILEVSVVIALLVLFVFFLCFFKGGSLHD